MADPTPQKPPGPAKYILLGCGILTAVMILGMGGCGAVFYFIYKGTDSIAEVGAAYLRGSPELKSAFGDDLGVRRKPLGWNVHIVNDGGNARIEYAVSGAREKAERDAVVWLVRSGGKWSAVGARVNAKEGPIKLGKPSADSLLKQDD